MQIAYKLTGDDWNEVQFNGNGYTDLVEEYIDLTFKAASNGALRAQALNSDAEVQVNFDASMMAGLKNYGLFLKGQKFSYVKAVLRHSTENGVEEIELGGVDFNEPVEIYTLQGVRVNEMTKGVYIVRQGKNVVKVMK